jgi:uncharacterized protein YndB with AHSA1/START domain
MAGFILVLAYFGMAAVAAAILMQPDKFYVSRAATIDAPPEKVFACINDLQRWNEWAPWMRLDPKTETRLSGASSGVSAAIEWSGDKRAGAGRLTIVGSRPDEGVDLKLELERPFRSTGDVTLALTPEGAPSAKRTSVVVTVSGRNTLVSKAVNLAFGTDRKLGAIFDDGLASLNALLAS